MQPRRRQVPPRPGGVALDAGDAQAHLGGANGRDVAAGAAPDHRDVEFPVGQGVPPVETRVQSPESSRYQRRQGETRRRSSGAARCRGNLVRSPAIHEDTVRYRDDATPARRRHLLVPAGERVLLGQRDRHHFHPPEPGRAAHRRGQPRGAMGQAPPGQHGPVPGHRPDRGHPDGDPGRGHRRLPGQPVPGADPRANRSSASWVPPALEATLAGRASRSSTWS